MNSNSLQNCTSYKKDDEKENRGMTPVCKDPIINKEILSNNYTLVNQ